MNLKNQIEDNRILIESLLKEYLPKETGRQKRIAEAMNYSVMGGGKRIRPQLMLESYRLFSDAEKEGATFSLSEFPKDLAAFMVALECIHNYSLIHDDLPAMDNDEYRRGRKTTHVVFGEDIAILAGDALLNYAYEVAASAPIRLLSEAPSGEAAERIFSANKAMAVLAGKAGIYGMVGGQCVDVMNENNPDITMEDILFIHENKTAALIEAALLCGGILAGASDADCEKLAKAGSYIGLAFQIQDDILDETATFEELGKPIGSDKDNGKVTYLSLNGMEASANKVEELTEEAIALLEVNGRRNEVLEGLLMSLVHRKS